MTSASATVMNNADLLSHQILPFIIVPRPQCCDGCKRLLPLRLFKSPPTPRRPSGEREWFCDKCWVSTVRWETNVLDICEGKVTEAIQNANPTFDRKRIKKELDLITDDKLLFKTHRIKKTAEKAKLYEEYIYTALREWYKKRAVFLKTCKNLYKPV